MRTVEARSFRLSTRLGIAHGVLVALLLVLLVVTLQGLVRMRRLVVEIRDQALSSVDAEEELHRAAWRFDVAMRHGRLTCAANANDEQVSASLAKAKTSLDDVIRRRGGEGPERLRAAVQQYALLATGSQVGDVCSFLLSATVDQERTLLDEELTDAWIDRLHELHVDIQAKDDRARTIGTMTTWGGLGVAAVAVAAAIAIARSTSRSVTDPISRLAAAATRIGKGDFATIPSVSGPREVEELWLDLERARGRLQELDQLKQSFLASVSHEMRSPLTTVREALSLLADGTCGTMNAQQARVVALALRACEREVRIVEALLDLSRFRSGMPLKLDAACDVAQIVEAAVDDERETATECGVHIDVVNSVRTPPMQVDSVLIERAVANLVRNAVSVSKRDQRVRVVLGVKVTAEARVLLIEIVDEGPGVPDELGEALFHPFTAAPVRGIKRPAGIGLGLSFAREVARGHGGDLTVSRSDERGTTFRLSLPIHPSTKE
ncbi:MAG: Osmosensitive channel histidine kinase KdpD [Myxococcaceae bacterium]|nr:Osmosensitive channel histidine kinase KdpD [Myxococcaceae bacterium]